MTNEMLGVSVIIPAYNAAEFIADALESLLAQSIQNWEAIVIDDGSTDDTMAVASRFTERDSRFRILSQAHQGISAARNAGISHSKFGWLLFLDADDWVLPAFLEKITSLLEADPSLDAAYCGCTRQFPDGSQIACDYVPASADMFLILARSRAFPIHACIVRRSRVEGVGGFDPSLATFEDWDLWQRIARAGSHFGSLNEILACYRIRPKSASLDSLQLLRDGLQVIQRGHSEDPRVPNAHPAWAEGLPSESLCGDQLHLACWAAGLAIGSGQDAQFLLKELDDVQDPGLDSQAIANMLYASILPPDARNQADWLNLWTVWHPRIQQFLLALEKQSLTPALTRRVTTALERLILDRVRFVEPVKLAMTAGIRVEITQPFQDLALPNEVERAFCRIEMEGKCLGTIELPVVGGVVSKYVLTDSIAAEYAWSILGRFFEYTVYRDLAEEYRPTGLSLLRGNVVLAEGLPLDQVGDWSQLHDQIGWLVFMQEIWDRPNWENKHFYEEVISSESAVVRALNRAVILVELTDELADIRTPHEAVQVIYTVGGVPVGSLQVAVEEHLLRASQLRVAINYAAGFEVCRAAVREGLLGKPLSGSGSLRTRLSDAAAVRIMEGPSQRLSNAELDLLRGEAVESLDLSVNDLSGLGVESSEVTSKLIIGRRVPSRLGTSHSRRAILPADTASELVDAARSAGEMILQRPEEERLPDQVLYAPEVMSHPDESLTDLPATRTSSKRNRLDVVNPRARFESIFAAKDDPWKYTSDYERVKYEQTLSLLPNQPYGRALEIGCAEGHFTRMLVPRVEQLIAADISEIALKRAADRCVGLENIHYRQLDLTKDPLDGPYDLILCSEILYYVGGKEALNAVVQKIAAALKPGGYFLTAHAHLVVDEPDRAGFDWDQPFGAKVISDYAEKNGFVLRKEIRTPLYRVQLFQRLPRLSMAKLLNRPQITILEKQPTDLHPEIASHVLWQGTNTRVNYQAQAETTKRLPILMYHRIAPNGSPRLANYRLAPETFREQLRYLSDAGYYSLTLNEWHIARESRKPIPGKPVILTFDDGYCDFKEHAWPLLREYGFSATVFLVSSEIGKTNRWDEYYGERLPLMGWPDILLLQKEGIEFGSHSATHPHLNGVSHSEVVREASISRKVLQDKLGEPVDSFAYPYGSSDRVVQHLVGACGYIYALTIMPRPCHFNDPLLALPRIEIRGTDDLQRFIQKLQ